MLNSLVKSRLGPKSIAGCWFCALRDCNSWAPRNLLHLWVCETLRLKPRGHKKVKSDKSLPTAGQRFTSEGISLSLGIAKNWSSCFYRKAVWIKHSKLDLFQHIHIVWRKSTYIDKTIIALGKQTIFHTTINNKKQHMRVLLCRLSTTNYREIFSSST